MAQSDHTHLLVLRFSAMGDVAMTVPVIRCLLDQHPNMSVTFVSDEKLAPLFANISRLDFFAADIHGKYSGITGLFSLFRDIKKIKNISAVADLHNVLRTKFLTFLFRLSWKKVSVIDKGRDEKNALTRKDNKKMVQLPTSFQRYADVFEKLGYKVDLSIRQTRTSLPLNEVVKQLLGNNSGKRIGIAPFARHKEKLFPTDKMKEVVKALSGKGYSLFLLGGGGDEIKQLEQWERECSRVLNIAGELPFDEELTLISHLDLMISMDSANMHLASLYGIPVVSIWGATHPFAGFYGFGQEPGNAVQADLFCRPCSVFGNKTCYRGNWECMQLIRPEHIISKAENILNNS